MICEKCGRENEERYKFCLGCGAPLSRMKPRAEVTSEAGPLPVISSGNISVVEPAASQVPVGRPIIPASVAAAAAPVDVVSAPDTSQAAPVATFRPEERVCTGCGALVPPDFIFCGRCGTRYEVTQPQADASATIEDETLGAAQGDTQTTSPVRGCFVLINPDGTPGESIALVEGVNLLGRQTQVTLLEEDEFLSPEHVQVICRGGKVIVEDLNSLNGIFLRLDEAPVTLRHNDLMRVGQELLRFVEPGRRAMLVPGDDQTMVLGSPTTATWGALHRVVAPDTETSVFMLTGKQQVIGRESGTIVFRDDGFVSGQHARLAPTDEGGVQLQDLNSSNGTYIRVRGPYEVQDGDFLLMGQQLFLVSLE